MTYRYKVNQFLSKYGQAEQQVDQELWLTRLNKHMNMGLSGENTEVLMYPSYLSSDFKIKSNVQNIVIDAGGTNFRCCLGFFDDEKRPIFIEEFKSLMPGVKETVSKQNFYDTIAHYISPLLGKGKNIGYCFSYACDMTPDVDGIVKVLSKEVKAPEVEGTKVGKCTLDALGKYGADKKIVVLNDTVATLLGGIGYTNNRYDSYVGYICGTGTNVSYIENNANILKMPDLPQGNMVMNTEIGSFSDVTNGEIDKIIDKNTTRPGSQLAEKMSSGRYISQIIKLAIAQAQYERLISGRVKLDSKFFNSSYIGTAAISKYLNGDFEARFSRYFSDEADIETVREIAVQVIDRGAKVGALLVSACAIKCGKGLTPDKPICIVAEGSTYTKLYGFRACFEKYLYDILTEKGIYFEIISDQNFNSVGTLAASMILED